MTDQDHKLYAINECIAAAEGLVTSLESISYVLSHLDTITRSPSLPDEAKIATIAAAGLAAALQEIKTGIVAESGVPQKSRRFYISYTIADPLGRNLGSGFAFANVPRWSAAEIWHIKESIAKSFNEGGTTTVEAKNIIFLNCIALEE